MVIDDNLNADVVESLGFNTGRVVTIFTQSGGCSGRGFTGILSCANCRFVKLITRIPCGPESPFGGEFRGNGFRSSCCCGNPLGTVVVIPTNKIVSYVFNEL